MTVGDLREYLGDKEFFVDEDQQVEFRLLEKSGAVRRLEIHGSKVPCRGPVVIRLIDREARDDDT